MSKNFESKIVLFGLTLLMEARFLQKKDVIIFLNSFENIPFRAQSDTHSRVFVVVPFTTEFTVIRLCPTAEE